MKGKFLIFLAILAFSVNLNAQILEPVKWQFSSNKLSDTEYELVFTADIEQHWHLYSQDIPMAPPATTFIFEEGEGFKLVGLVTEESKVIEEFDPNFDMVLKYFAYKAVFKQKVKLISEGAVVKGYLNFMCCDDTKCLPPTDVDYSFELGTVANSEQTATIESGTDTDESSMDTADILGKNSSLWGFFILSFIGGLVAILTPCVFPMIPMTISFFMKDGEDKKKGKMQALLYGFSIIAIYTFIGSVLAVVAGPNIANWLSTHWHQKET